MKARLTGGLVAAALLGTGLICPGAAVAAGPSGYPHELGFEPSQIVVVGDTVYASGVTDDGVGHVAEVGGQEVEVGEDLYRLQMAAQPSGDALRVVTGDEDGSHYWNLDTDDLTPTPDGAPAAGHDIEALGTDAGGVYEVQNGASFALNVPELGSFPLAESAAASATAARGSVGARTWYVAGTQFDDDAGNTATLWSYDEGAGQRATPVTLGAAGDPDDSPLDVAVDPTEDVVYALGFRSNDDAPQSYGITIVQDGATVYVPLRYTAGQIELSPDGETLYVTQGFDTILALDTDELADYTEDSDVRQTWLDADSWIGSLAVDTDGTVYAGAGDDVYALSRPSAPTGLVTTPDSMSTTAFSASWDDGKYAWELGDDEDLTEYEYTVRDSADHVVYSDSGYDQVVHVDGLATGATYTVEVATSNGIFTSEPVVSEITTYNRHIVAPSAVAVQGSLTVGSQLSLGSTGSWEDGTTLVYEWYGSTGEMGGAIGSGPTLTLTADHLGMSITGVVTGTKAGAAGVTLDASATGTVSPAVITPPVITPPVITPPVITPPVITPPSTPAVATLKSAKPKVTGKAKVGKTLTAKAGSWTAGTKLAYQWLANGKRIKGADSKKLKLTKALKGKKISVAVTGTKAGYAKATKTSTQTKKVSR